MLISSSKIYKMLNKTYYHISVNDSIIYFGSDLVAAPSLSQLILTFPNLQVVTHYNKGKSHNEVQSLCKKHNIKLYTPITDKSQAKQEWPQFKQQLSIMKPSIGVVCSFGYMIPSYIISAFSQGMIVVHPSLLPKYRGGAPIFHAIANGDTVSGVTYIEISTNKFDAGNILYQKSIQIPLDQKYKHIEQLLAHEAAKHIVYVLHNLDQLRPGRSQDSALQSKAPIHNNNYLDLKSTAQTIYHLSRAIKSPRLRIEGGELIVAFKNEYLEQKGEIGDVLIQDRKVFIRCSDKYIRLIGYQEPSRGERDAIAFINKYCKELNKIRFY